MWPRLIGHAAPFLTWQRDGVAVAARQVEDGAGREHTTAATDGDGAFLVWTPTQRPPSDTVHGPEVTAKMGATPKFVASIVTRSSEPTLLVHVTAPTGRCAEDSESGTVTASRRRVLPTPLRARSEHRGRHGHRGKAQRGPAAKFNR